MRIYLDTCVLNRPIDDSSQERIRLESKALSHILRQVDLGKWTLLTSRVIEWEIDRIECLDRREAIRAILGKAGETTPVGRATAQFALGLTPYGIGGLDAMHLSSAHEGSADFFLTVDDRLHRRARAIASLAPMQVTTPPLLIELFRETIEP
ncbi:MAG: PIN domain-containing protein [Candidatus Sumerlaeia bacterium]|nr:PIN domain-containing protein [Candidatus Sumerlaeia bacterium]